MSYSDYELLKLASKAAGIELRGWSSTDDGGIEKLEAALVLHHQKQGCATSWNPLADDGDALRLAVKLSIHIRMWAYACEAQDNNGRNTGLIHASDCDGDLAAATRRSIVLAAAAIGEAMQ